MTLDPLPPEVWAAEGRRVAPALQDVAAAVITGRTPEAAAEVALAIAAAHAPERRVAIADLVGGIPQLGALSEGRGLLECLRDGDSISEIARPLTADGSIFVLPAGRGVIAERWVFESARWDRLVGGFREVDALLLLVAPPWAPGLETLIGRVDGVVAVDLPPNQIRAWPLLATVDRPEAELPEIVVGRRALRAASGTARLPRAAVVALVALVATGLGAASWSIARQSRLASAQAASLEASARGATARARPEEVRIVLGEIVNPGDSTRAAVFAVELIAANTLTSANSRLVALGAAAPAPTVAPLELGGEGRTWYRVIVGAWQLREDAERWLASERARGALRADGGRVVIVPLALELAVMRDGTAAAEAIVEWRSRGISAYALRSENGRIRIYAGAFEGSAQAAVLAMRLRALGAEPRLAYRIGRSF